MSIPGGAETAAKTIELQIAPRARDLGGFSVRRALPDDRRQMVGPFVFYDHFGPVQFGPGQGIDVRPHPHIGLATVTYLFDGRILHRDSLANVQEIAPGAMNLMTAGRGIVHSERTPPGPRAAGQQMLGVQSWLALPLAHEETEPSFQHFSANVLPIVEDQGVFARVIAGAAFGTTSPVETLSDWFYVELRLAAGASAPLDADYEQRALYLVEGAVEIAGERFDEPQLLIFSPGAAITIRALSDARMMLLGGAPVDGRRYVWWNLVSSSKERIEQAKRDWREGKFPSVPGDAEFIPLPEA
ncbi:pirin family protein [Methylocystis sp. H4A]|uniref:pirin family protein n=1 Tax=Methylocystis sp. H4A TaxID=2785788 RepID=UPI0018C2832D|nr:pirin family protein [Methylocystis sp. H4A]MBG0803301.1 pirin family protein [Methylocystis sp. H4A]